MSSRLGPKPRLGYTNSRIERAAELRTDASAIAALTKHPGAGTYVIGGEWIVAKKGSPLSEPLFTPAEVHQLGPPAETIFLGLLDGAPRFGHGLSPQSAEALKSRSDLLVTDLRSIAVQGLVSAEDLPPIAEAKA
ncbi:MAG TPA: NADH pyrophosphatase, partial [Pseudolabrys sp.]|nr:NADH pyrophosphatase [Pseudolabrys sp.]